MHTPMSMVQLNLQEACSVFEWWAVVDQALAMVSPANK